jgi:serine protease DegQ
VGAVPKRIPFFRLSSFRLPRPRVRAPDHRLLVAALRSPLSVFYRLLRPALLITAGALIAIAATLLLDASKPPPQRLTQRDINAAVVRAMASAIPQPSAGSRVYQTIRPSLVRIEAQTPNSKSGGKPDPAKPNTAIGTGVIFDDTGTILSSLHIVKDATTIKVIYVDGTDSEATIAATKPESDLVVLKPQVTPDDLVPAILTASESLQVGDEVFAVGNPFGIHDSISAGIVSRLNLSYNSAKQGIALSNLIVFDTAVNPGNSGGPLLNRDGEVVGIVTGLLNPTEQEVFIGIGFAVPLGDAASAVGEPPY